MLPLRLPIALKRAKIKPPVELINCPYKLPFQHHKTDFLLSKMAQVSCISEESQQASVASLSVYDSTQIDLYLKCESTVIDLIMEVPDTMPCQVPARSPGKTPLDASPFNLVFRLKSPALQQKLLRFRVTLGLPRNELVPCAEVTGILLLHGGPVKAAWGRA